MAERVDIELDGVQAIVSCRLLLPGATFGVSRGWPNRSVELKGVIVIDLWIRTIFPLVRLAIFRHGSVGRRRKKYLAQMTRRSGISLATTTRLLMRRTGHSEKGIAELAPPLRACRCPPDGGSGAQIKMGSSGRSSPEY